MLIYDELKSDHDKVKKLLDRLISATGPETKNYKLLVNQIRDALIPHSRAEEAVFYNSLRGVDKAKSLAWHGYQEHVEAESILRGLQALDAFDVTSMALAKKLQDALTHHISDEEGKIFSAAKKLFAPEEAEAMGEAFVKMKAELKGDSFMQNSIDIVANLMPPRLRGFFGKVATQVPGGSYVPESRAS